MKLTVNQQVSRLENLAHKWVISGSNDFVQAQLNFTGALREVLCSYGEQPGDLGLFTTQYARLTFNELIAEGCQMQSLHFTKGERKGSIDEQGVILWEDAAPTASDKQDEEIDLLRQLVANRQGEIDRLERQVKQLVQLVQKPMTALSVIAAAIRQGGNK